MKHLSKIVLSLLVTGVLAAAVQAEPGGSEAGVAQPSWVRVTGDRVNLRARPSFENSEVLGQADYDERLEVREMGDDWVGVVAPDRISLWVSSQYVRTPENVIGGSRVNIRTGPSQNHTIALVLNRGDSVVPREVQGDWTRIAVPEGALVWVSRDFVELADAEKTRTEGLENPILKRAREEAAAAAASRAAEGAQTPSSPPPVTATTAVPPPPVPPTQAEEVAVAPAAEAAPAPALEHLPAAPATDAAALARPPRRRDDRPAPPIRPRELPEVAVETPAVKLEKASPELPTPIVLPSVPAAEEDADAWKKTASPAGVPASFKLIPLEGQGRQATYEGVLRGAPLFNDAPARYRVLRWDPRAARWELLCHVYGEASKFRYLQDKPVRVRGREYWLQNTAAPVLVPDMIQELLPTDLAR